MDVRAPAFRSTASIVRLGAGARQRMGISRADAEAALQAGGIREAVNWDAAPYVQLSTQTPFVEGKGWLEFVGGWQSVSCGDSGSAAWVSGTENAGELDIWLRGLSAGTMYLVSVDVGCATLLETQPQFEIHSSVGPWQWVSAIPPEQTLLIVLPADAEMALLTIQPRQLWDWIFFRAVVREFK